MDNKNFKRICVYVGITALLVIAACVLFASLVFNINTVWYYIKKIFGVLSPVIIGLIIAYLINPMVKFFAKYIYKVIGKKASSSEKAGKAARVSNAIAVVIATLVFAVVIIGFFWLVIPQLISSISSFVLTLPEKINIISDWVKERLNEDKQLQTVLTGLLDYGNNWVKNDLSKFATNAASYLASGVWSVVNFLKNFGLGLIFAIYLLLSKERLIRQCKKMLFAFLDDKTVASVLEWLSRSHEVFSGFINGKLLDSLIIGILCFIGTTILRIPYALLVSVVVGVTNVIPVFGPYIGGVPAAILVTIADPLKGLYFSIFIILLQALDGNVIGPKILGDKIGLSNIWVMFAIVVAGGLFGLPGMLIGVPAFAVIYYAFALLVNHRLKKKNKSTLSDDYSREALEKSDRTEET